jgi:hypothetical protein
MTAALPETKLKIFGIYNGWLYTGMSDLSNLNDDEVGDADENMDWAINLGRAYALGDYLQDSVFKNAVCDKTMFQRRKWNSIPSVEKINRLWRIVPHDSKFAKMMMDYVAADLPRNTFATSVSTYPTDFVVYLATVCVEERAISTPK